MIQRGRGPPSNGVPTRFTSVETGSKLEVLSRLCTTLFFLGRKSGARPLPIYIYIIYRVRFKTLKKQRSSYSVHLLRRKSFYTLYKRYLILRWNSESCRLRRKRDGDSSLSFHLFHLSSLHPFRLITPPLFVRLISYLIPADGDTNDMSLTTSAPPRSLSRTRESPAISRLRVVNVINNYVARAAWRDRDDDHPPQCTLFWSGASPTTLTHIHIYTYID